MSTNTDDELAAINKKRLADMAKAAGAQQEPTQEEIKKQQLQMYIQSLQMEFAAVMGQCSNMMNKQLDATIQSMWSVINQMKAENFALKNKVTEMEEELRIFRSGGKPPKPDITVKKK